MNATLIGKTIGLRAVNAALLFLAGSLIVAGACSFAPAPPDVDQATIWIDEVERGDLMIERRGAGHLEETEDGRLVAVVRIPESQSLDLEIGQEATVDLTVANVRATISELGDRIIQGTRIVRLEFAQEPPAQALPGMSIDAAIRVDVRADVLYVGKPAYARANSEIGLFRLVDDGRFAERVPVRTGASSINLIEIASGLEEGDQIILSDMSRYDATSRVALR